MRNISEWVGNIFIFCCCQQKKKRKREWTKSSWKEHSDQRWGERTCVTEMENDERITLVSRMRVMRKSSNIFSLLADTRTYLAQPDGDAYVGCKTCETLLYVSSPCGFRIAKSRQFRQYKNIYAQSLVVNYMESYGLCSKDLCAGLRQ